jgi:hypothetical protein
MKVGHYSCIRASLYDMSMYRTERVSVCNINTFRCWTKSKRTIIDELRRVAPPFWSSFVEIQESKEYERP